MRIFTFRSFIILVILYAVSHWYYIDSTKILRENSWEIVGFYKKGEPEIAMIQPRNKITFNKLNIDAEICHSYSGLYFIFNNKMFGRIDSLTGTIEAECELEVAFAKSLETGLDMQIIMTGFNEISQIQLYDNKTKYYYILIQKSR